VTETSATVHAEPSYPPGRYGRRREPRPRRRWLVAVLAVAVGLAALAISIRMFQQYGQPDFEPQVRRYYDVTDTGITVEFSVRQPPGKPGTCVVRARSAAGAQVALDHVDTPVGTRVVVTHRLTTSARPAVVEVPRCNARS
jgi:hypothetical protein